MNPTSLDHLGIFVSDLNESRAFCERTLGMTFVELDEDETVHMVTLRAGSQEVHLFRSKGEYVGPRHDHVALRVTRTELERAMTDMAARGIGYSGPHRYKDTRFIKVKDSDGLTWELIAAMAP